MQVILMGYRGSGKSTIGRVLAERLGYQFVDLDDLRDLLARRGQRRPRHDVPEQHDDVDDDEVYEDEDEDFEVEETS